MAWLKPKHLYFAAGLIGGWLGLLMPMLFGEAPWDAAWLIVLPVITYLIASLAVSVISNAKRRKDESRLLSQDSILDRGGCG